jgi:hypothetical protein
MRNPAICKILQVVPKCPRATSAQTKKFYTQNVFFGLCDAAFPYKRPVKNWKNVLPPTCDMRSRSHFFLRQVQFVKAGAMGVVLAVSFFGNAGLANPAVIIIIPP